MFSFTIELYTLQATVLRIHRVATFLNYFSDCSDTILEICFRIKVFSIIITFCGQQLSFLADSFIHWHLTVSHVPDFLTFLGTSYLPRFFPMVLNSSCLRIQCPSGHILHLSPDFMAMIPDQFPSMYAFACSTAFVSGHPVKVLPSIFFL